MNGELTMLILMRRFNQEKRRVEQFRERIEEIYSTDCEARLDVNRHNFLRKEFTKENSQFKYVSREILKQIQFET